MAELVKKFTTETLLAKLPPETCWAITAETLSRLAVLRMMKTSAPLLGKDEGILSLLSGWEKEVEVKKKIWEEGAKKMFPWITETFNIPVEDAVEAANFSIVVATLMMGPEEEDEIVEATPERAIYRSTKCLWWERWKEQEVDPGLIPCPITCEATFREGLKAVNPKLTYKATKFMTRGDPYCEGVIEFKEE